MLGTNINSTFSSPQPNNFQICVKRLIRSLCPPYQVNNDFTSPCAERLTACRVGPLRVE